MGVSLLILAALVGISAAWQNCDRPEIQTATTNGAAYTLIKDYDFKEKESVIVFSVKACKNARLRMTETSNPESKGLNINIDVRSSGKPMTYVNFRKGNGKWERVLGFNVGKQLNCQEYRDFWVSWNANIREVAIGKGRNPNAEAYGKTIVPESQASDLKYLHISSNRQNKALWSMYKQCDSNVGADSCGAGDTACNTCKGELLTTVENPVEDYVTLYDLVDMLNKEPSVVVGVKSCEGVRMRFLEEKNLEGLGYNVNIDIRLARTGDKVFHQQINYRTGDVTDSFKKTRDITTDPKLSCNSYNYFWVSWDYDAGRLSVGEGKDPSKGEYMYSMMAGARKHQIRYMAISAQNECIGSYKIYSQCDLPAVIPSCSASNVCEDDNSLCVDGTCESCPEGTKVHEGECKTVCLEDTGCDGNSACDVGVSVCVECPAGTAPRIGSCDETCSANDACSDPNHACIDGFCDPCLVNEIVRGGACVSICELKKNEGTCSSKTTRYYYKPGQLICVAMQGCNGDGLNSFASKADCIDVCLPKEIPPECLLDTDAGSCEDYSKRYFYNKEVQACKKFEYNGCDGNANNFPSKEACRLHCAKYD